ncbi:MAG: hypothetical protein Q7T68_15705 [Sphingopyxis sp.]|nr:hypothetical protein [Sphingopyxis sp.]
MIAALLVLMLAPETIAEDDQWVCTARAKGQRDARVDVSIQLTTDRDILVQNVGWSPPRAARAGSSRPDIEAPGLTLYYEYAEAGDIGDLTNALGDVSSIDAPAGTFDDMALGVRIDQGDTWYVALETLESMDLAPEYRIGETKTVAPPLDFRSAWLADADTDIDPLEGLGAARVAKLSLVDRKGRPVSQISYDLSATAERDRLFAKAWKKAETLALHPTRCTRAATDE